MTKELLLQKETIEVSELLEYFGVKNTAELENYFAMKVATPYLDLKMNDAFLFNGFRLVYEKVSLKTYNPIEESLMIYMVLLEGLFSFDGEEIALLTKTFGTFKSVYFISTFLEDNEIVRYYKLLYNEYVEKMTSIPLIMSDGIEAISKFLEKKLEGITEENLVDMVKKIQSNFEEFKKEIN